MSSLASGLFRSGLNNMRSVSSTSLTVSTSPPSPPSLPIPRPSVRRHAMRWRNEPLATEAGYSLAKDRRPRIEARRSSSKVAEARREDKVEMVSPAVCFRGALSIVSRYGGSPISSTQCGRVQAIFSVVRVQTALYRYAITHWREMDLASMSFDLGLCFSRELNKALGCGKYSRLLTHSIPSLLVTRAIGFCSSLGLVTCLASALRRFRREPWVIYTHPHARVLASRLRASLCGDIHQSIFFSLSGYTLTS